MLKDNSASTDTNTTAKDEALDIYIKLSQADEVSKEDRIAFYEYLILKINYLKGLVKDDMQKQL